MFRMSQAATESPTFVFWQHILKRFGVAKMSIGQPKEHITGVNLFLVIRKLCQQRKQ